MYDSNLFYRVRLLYICFENFEMLFKNKRILCFRKLLSLNNKMKHDMIFLVEKGYATYKKMPIYFKLIIF